MEAKAVVMAEAGLILPIALSQRLEAGDAPLVVDVRELPEVEVAAFPNAYHIPMGEITSRLDELDPDREIVVVCHHGMRSAQVAAYLADSGFSKVLNLAGGIDAWSVEVDSSVPRY